MSLPHLLQVNSPKLAIFAIGLLVVSVNAHAIRSPDVPGCIIDEDMSYNYLESEKFTETIIEATMPVVDIRRAACFSKYKNIGADISGTFSGGFDWGKLLDIVKEAACREAEGAIDSMIGRLSLNYQAPYGLAGGGISVGSGGWTAPRISTTNTTMNQAERVAATLGTQIGRKAVEDVSKGKSSITEINRDLNREANRTNDEYWQDAHQRVRDKVK